MTPAQVHVVRGSLLIPQETTENNHRQEIETMKQQLQAYQEKEQENQEAVDKQAAHQTELMKEIADLRKKLETERVDVGKLREDVNKMTHERDIYKRKVEEVEMQSEESKVSIVVENLFRALGKL